jgi:nitrite reductase/ring-hydroxylating ferredoxin subunit
MEKKIKVARKNDVPMGTGICVTANAKKIALFNIDGKFYAIDDECTHAGASLCEGQISGTTIVCPWHAAVFDLTNGQPLEPPAFDPVNSYKVILEGDDVYLELS